MMFGNKAGTKPTESDVEQKFVYQLLTDPSPLGLGYNADEIATKPNIRRVTIQKGKSRKLYFPDYVVMAEGMPSMVVEVKAKSETDLSDAIAEARLYCCEINSKYPRSVNPCAAFVVTNGEKLIACYWDSEEPEVELEVSEQLSINADFEKFCALVSKASVGQRSQEMKKAVRNNARFFKPIHMLGGYAVINESVGQNEFGANVSLEYQSLFNPEKREDRTAIAENAYVESKRRLSHVPSIDKIIRAAKPAHELDSLELSNTGKPKEIISALERKTDLQNQLCLLIGGVGAGKSTFTEYLRVKALPDDLKRVTQWVRVDMNLAPLSRDLVYDWIVSAVLKVIHEDCSDFDLDELATLFKIYQPDIDKVKKGRAALFEGGSTEHSKIISETLGELQNDKSKTLLRTLQFLFTSKGILPILVLDNSDKRTRDDQLLMFEVAEWVRNTFPLFVFLPLRDTTYDQYNDHAPLDTVIKDLVFRIEPPLLDNVLYERLKYLSRLIEGQSRDFKYWTPNSMAVKVPRSEVIHYLRSVVKSLFQRQYIRSLIKGVAGRNIRKGMEIILDFCKSGHISEAEILKMRTSQGDYELPLKLVYDVLFRKSRKFFGEEHSNFVNLFSCETRDEMPDPFVRVDILIWLQHNLRKKGPSGVNGFHKFSDLVSWMQQQGHIRSRVIVEANYLLSEGCIASETQNEELSIEELVRLSPKGSVHLGLLDDVNYLATVAEDSLFRDNAKAKEIKDIMIGASRFRVGSLEAVFHICIIFLEYLQAYKQDFLLGSDEIFESSDHIRGFDINKLLHKIKDRARNHRGYGKLLSMEQEYPSGSEHIGQVVSIQDYGFFVEIGMTGSGLVHRKAMQSPNDVLLKLQEGDDVIVKVIQYNQEHGRLELELVSL